MPYSRATAAKAPVKPGPVRSQRPTLPGGSEIPSAGEEAIQRARESLQMLQLLQRRTKWHPTWSQILARDYQQARAMLSKAEATYEAFRRGREWATITQMAADYEKFSVFVRDLYERGNWRERDRRPRRTGR